MNKLEIKNIDKFSDKAELYTKYRPGYPDEFIKYLWDDVGIKQRSVVTDIGSGTGILSRKLLEICDKVYCVEPNDSMRRFAENALGEYPNFVSINGMDENTTLPGSSIDFITVAQAFHWFDLEKFKNECQRILKPSGKAVLIWNSKTDDDPVSIKRDLICRKYCPDFKGFAGGQGTEGAGYTGMTGFGYTGRPIEKPDNCVAFFKNGCFEFKEFENNFYGDIENFIGGNLSSSYAPKDGDKNYIPFVEELTKLFNENSKDGEIMTLNVTRSYAGEV